MSTTQPRPRQFSFRKPIVARPEGEVNELKSNLLRKWSLYLHEYNEKNASTIERLATEHPVVWKRTPRTPCVMLPFDVEEQKAFSTGNFQVHYRREHGGGKKDGSLPRNQSSQPSKKNYNPPASHSKKNIDWRIDQSKDMPPDERHKHADDEEILWATDESGVGMFDGEGNFKFISDSIVNDSEGSCKAPLNKEALFGSPPKKTPLPTASQPPPNPPWLYKDPKGNVQGPFNSVQMFDWYSRGFFPDSLPLCREGELVFESLAVWKAKFNGKCPFEPAAVSSNAPGFSMPIEPSRPVTLSPSSHAQQIRFGTVLSGEDPIVNVPVRKPAASSASGPAKQTPTVVDEVEEQRRFLEGLMVSSKQKEPYQPVKKVQLAQIMADQAQELQTKYTMPSSSPALRPAPLSNPVVAKESAGAWKTVHATNPIQSLSEIQKQQQQQQSEREKEPKALQQNPSGPKSFADLLATSAPVSTKSSVVEKTQSIKKTVSPIQPPISKPKATSQMPSSQPSTATPSQPKPDSLKDWVISKLALVQVDAVILLSLLADCQSPEEAACLLRDNLIDTVLSEQKPAMMQFGKEYLKKRFGKQVSSAVLEIVCSKPVDDRDERKEADFLTVVRRKK